MTARSLLAVTAVIVLSGCAGDADRVPRSQQLWKPKGDTVSCINLRQIRSTNVIDDRTIHFVVNNRRMFRNELPNRCPGLGFNRAFSHNSRSSQLCSMNLITVIQGGAAPQGATCSLGRFQPMIPVPPATPVPPSG